MESLHWSLPRNVCSFRCRQEIFQCSHWTRFYLLPTAQSGKPSALLSVRTSSDVSVSLAAFLAALSFLLPPSNVLHTCLSLSVREPFELRRAPYCIAFKVYSRCEENISVFGVFLPSFNLIHARNHLSSTYYTHYGLKLDSFHACRY